MNNTLETYKKKFRKGDSDGVFKYFLGKVCNRFIKNYNARKQKAYMRSNLYKPPQVPVKMMNAKLKVMNAYLPSFPGPENSPFLTGEMIDIILGMIPKH